MSAKEAQKFVYHPSIPKPTMAEVPYGKHERHVLDFWQAKSDKPTPLVFVTHGGGWAGASKEILHGAVDTPALLKAGISVVAINYRLIGHAIKDGVNPPVMASLMDAARALQFVRSKAKEWNIDKTKVGVGGASAGAVTSLWLALHEDLADPKNDDPIARESTHVTCVSVVVPQTTLDPKLMREWIPNAQYGGHAFKLWHFEHYLKKRDTVLKWIKKVSPYDLVSKDAPPIYMFYGDAPSRKPKDPTHSANFGVEFQKKCLKLGVECELVHKGTKKEDINYKNTTEFLIEKLNK